MNQRWNQKRDSYRPSGEPIQTSAYEVAPLPQLSIAKAFVEEHHYIGSMSQSTRSFGLYRRGQLVGVAVYGNGTNKLSITNVFPDRPGRPRGLVLSRFILLDDVPANGETWFLARTFELLRTEEIPGIVSFSDDVPRTTAAGRLIFPGHIGTIYQAHNGTYLGRGARALYRLFEDGSVLDNRAKAKIRKHEPGWRYAAEKLVSRGAAPLGDEDPARWLAFWQEHLTRRLSHPGCHKYAWGLNRRAQKEIQQSLPYPKRRAV